MSPQLLPRALLAPMILALLMVPVGRSSHEPTAPLRRPVALALGDHDRLLWVANQRTGTISVIDTQTLRPTTELSAGQRLSDLAVTPDGRYLLATDEAAHELLRRDLREPARPVERVPV